MDPIVIFPPPLWIDVTRGVADKTQPRVVLYQPSVVIHDGKVDVQLIRPEF
ncbi:hypothetical protein F183_A00050 [Bryobacterales bacterium F-183]|nr:hypothetical protein F183_A00050 [Bryobacterales bacterium F-183]